MRKQKESFTESWFRLRQFYDCIYYRKSNINGSCRSSLSIPVGSNLNIEFTCHAIQRSKASVVRGYRKVENLFRLCQQKQSHFSLPTSTPPALFFNSLRWLCFYSANLKCTHLLGKQLNITNIWTIFEKRNLRIRK